MVDNSTSILDVLKNKHPLPYVSVERALLPCDDLLHIIDVDITEAQEEKVAREIQGGPGPGGSMTTMWQGCLLWSGVHSAELSDSIAKLARQLANLIILQNDIHALMASCLMALDECSGVLPIGNGEAPHSSLER